MRKILLSSLLTLISIGAWAEFVEIDGINYYLEDTKAAVAEKTDKYSGDVVIPATVSYGETVYQVTAILPFAFFESPDLTSVTLPNSVTKIGEAAFARCERLSSIDMGTGITTIEGGAFERTGLPHVVIPNSVTSMGDQVFAICTELNTVVLGEGLTEIPTNTFLNSSVSNIVFGSNVKYIRKWAFRGCSKLGDFVIPNGVEVIEEQAFNECRGLTSIAIPESVTKINNSTFSGCINLTSISLSNTLTAIGNSAFWGCEQLKAITLPNSVETLGNNSFSDCYNLETLTVGSGLKAIGETCFQNCTKLATISVDGENTFYDSRNNCNAIIETATNKLVLGCKGTVIPESVTTIGEGAFYGLSVPDNMTIPQSVTCIEKTAFAFAQAKSFVIPASVSSIGEAAFSRCYGLESIAVEEGNVFYDSREQCNAIIEKSNDRLIAACISTTIPQSVKIIGESSFIYMWELTSIDLPDGLTSIEDGAFYECIELTSVAIPNSVTYLGQDIFHGCAKLSSVTMGQNVTKIDKRAFSGCPLTKVYLPASVTFIGENAFTSNLTDVYCFAKQLPETSRKRATFTHPEEAILHVPAESIDLYKSDQAWNKFKEIVALTDEEMLAVHTTMVDGNDKMHYYSLDGCHSEGLRRGINIIKQGKQVKKVIVK